MLNQRGQGLLEFVVVFPVVAVFAAALIFLIILFGSLHSIQFITEEALYCSLHSDMRTCKNHAGTALRVLPGIQIIDFSISSRDTSRIVNLSWKLTPTLSHWLPAVGQNLHLHSDIEIFNEK